MTQTLCGFAATILGLAFSPGDPSLIRATILSVLGLIRMSSECPVTTQTALAPVVMPNGAMSTKFKRRIVFGWLPPGRITEMVSES